MIQTKTYIVLLEEKTALKIMQRSKGAGNGDN